MTPALGTPADEKKYGSGGSSEGMKAPEQGGDKPKFFASPLARKIALEKGVPLGKVKGTGPEGRITEVSQNSIHPSFHYPGLAMWMKSTLSLATSRRSPIPH